MKKTVVVGAGLVGSLLSLLLAKKGFKVDVYESRPDMRKAGYSGGRSINLAMSERGWRALEKAGIAKEIYKEGIPMYGRMIHNIDGSTVFQKYGKENQAIFSVSRGGLNRALLDLASQQEHTHFYFDHRCEGYDMTDKNLEFTDTATNKTKKVEADFIFATDGAYSAVRNSIQKRPRFNYSQWFLPHGYKELTIPAGANHSFLMEKNALHIWPRGFFMLIALPNPDGSFTCTLFLPFDEGNENFKKLQTDEAITHFFNTYFPDAVALFPNLVEEFKQNPSSPLVTVRCNPWSYQNTLLLGDAAHAIVPFYGQGMNAGFEDCSILDELLTEHGDDWDKIVEYYDTERNKDSNAIAELAFRNFVEMRDLVADPQFLLRKKIEARLNERYPDTFLPVYSMVTFSNIPYSAALAEHDRQNAMFADIFAQNPNPAIDSDIIDISFSKYYLR